jgi:hypothetical protein
MAKTRFHSALIVKIDAALMNRADDLSRGVPLESYLRNVGYCDGLREALVFCEEIEREFDGGSNG